MHHHAKFCANRSRRCGNMAVFRFSRWRPSAIMDFQKLEILTAHTLQGPKCVIVPNFVQIGQGVAEIWPFSIFQDGGRPPSWICYTPVWTTHEVYFGGLCHCVKFGLNRCSSFDNMQVLIFWALSLKMPIHASFLGVFGAKMGENRNFLYFYPSRNAAHPETRILSYNLSKSVQAVWRLAPPKKR